MFDNLHLWSLNARRKQLFYFQLLTYLTTKKETVNSSLLANSFLKKSTAQAITARLITIFCTSVVPS
jgi:hypothetical protein